MVYFPPGGAQAIVTKCLMLCIFFDTMFNFLPPPEGGRLRNPAILLMWLTQGWLLADWSCGVAATPLLGYLKSFGGCNGLRGICKRGRGL